MRFGYAYWGFLGDEKMDAEGRELSTPDGNATYSWSIIYEALKRGWSVFKMHEDRDLHAWRRKGRDLFSAFNSAKRLDAYQYSTPTEGWALPELDILLIEWRWPIPGRNCNVENGRVYFNGAGPLDHPDRDLQRQIQLLNHYKNKKTKIVIWDLDHKLTEEDERIWSPNAIFETSRKPRKLLLDRVKVEPPTIISDLSEFITLPSDVHRKLVYVGSRYERDDVIEEWIKPVSDKFPGEVEFWGNWTRPEILNEVKKMWPNIKYNGRITTKDFRKAYGDAVACPLLAKKSYLETGFITPRPWEALLFGTIPVGLSTHYGIENYVMRECIAKDADDLADTVEWLAGMNEGHRRFFREENIKLISHMDVKNFVDELEKVR